MNWLRKLLGEPDGKWVAARGNIYPRRGGRTITVAVNGNLEPESQAGSSVPPPVTDQERVDYLQSISPWGGDYRRVLDDALRAQRKTQAGRAGPPL